MIHDEIYLQINSLVTHFEKLATEYRQAKLVLYSHPSICLEGFARMLQNESKERWHTSEKVAKFLKENSRKITLDSTPKPKNDFGNVKEIFNYLIQLEEQTVSAISTMISKAIELKCYNSENFLKDLLMYSIHEYQEIKKTQHIINMTSEDNIGMMIQDQKLYEEYDPKYYHEKYMNCDD